MKKHRRTDRVVDLANGPAKLTEAFDITDALNGHDLTAGRKLFIVESSEPQTFKIKSTGRVGIVFGKEKLWRFFIKGNPFVSRQ
jgi:DNA-3-methyladenine glycosylase